MTMLLWTRWAILLVGDAAPAAAQLPRRRSPRYPLLVRPAASAACGERDRLWHSLEPRLAGRLHGELLDPHFAHAVVVPAPAILQAAMVLVALARVLVALEAEV